MLQAVSPGAVPPPEIAHERPWLPPMPSLGELRRVLALNQTQRQNGVAATILSLEDYQQGAILHGLTRPGQPPDHPPLMPRRVEAADELGAHYVCSLRPSFFDADSFHFSLRLEPALSPEAHSLRLEFDTRDVTDTAPRHWVFELPL